MSRGLGRKLRFACVGTAVAALYISLYAVFLWLGLPQFVANGLAFLLAVAVQYSGQAGYTFGAPMADRRQIGRFIAMIACGFVTSAIITGWLAPGLGLTPVAAAVTVALILPVQNYLIMSRWVFMRASDPRETLS